jgi:peptide/nickel transport system permease protein
MNWRPTGRTVAALVAILGVMILAVWWWLNHDPNAIDLTNRFASPSAQAPLGTDELGRDLLSRLIAGSVITIGGATATILLTATVGTLLGLFAAWRGGLAGTALLITTDSLVAVPAIVIALITVSILGTGLGSLVIAIAAAGWLPYARLSYELGTRVLSSDYATAARLTGAGPIRMVGLTLIPNVSRPLIAHAFLRFPGMLVLLSGLSFLGLGPQPPTAEWGAMLASGVDELERHPLVPLAPGVAIVVAGFIVAQAGRRLEAAAVGPDAKVG